MKYTGIVKKSRTIDLAIVNKMVDAAAATLILYSPEQLGVTIPTYFAIRMGLNILAIILRHKTTKPLDEK